MYPENEKYLNYFSVYLYLNQLYLIFVIQVTEIEGKGRGVVATKPFQRGDFVVEYAGDLIDLSLAKKREEKYSEDTDIGCYMYYFTHNNRRYW